MCMRPDALSARLARRTSCAVTIRCGGKEVAGWDDSTARATAIVLHPEDPAQAMPGSGVINARAEAGPLPICRHKDCERTASLFVLMSGAARGVADDHRRVARLAKMQRSWRSHLRIGTAGDTGLATRGDETLQPHPSGREARILATSGPRLGRAVCALVAGCAAAGRENLADDVLASPADVTRPRRIVVTGGLARAPEYVAVDAQARFPFEGAHAVISAGGGA
jgi:hypothetical protein